MAPLAAHVALNSLTQEDIEAKNAAAVKAAMLADLGIGRCEDLPMDDGGHDRRGRDRGGPSSYSRPPKQNGVRVVVDSAKVQAWQTAKKDGTFDDDDARGVKDLKNIAGGRLHTINRDGQGQDDRIQQVMDRFAMGLKQRQNGHEYAPHSKRGGYSNTPGQSHAGNNSIPSIQLSRNQPTHNQPVAKNIQASTPGDNNVVPPVREVEMQAPKDAQVNYKVSIYVTGEDTFEGCYVFLCYTDRPSESSFVIYFGPKRPVAYQSFHPCKLSNYLTEGARKLVLFFGATFGATFEFQTRSDMVMFWTKFQELKKAGDIDETPNGPGLVTGLQTGAQLETQLTAPTISSEDTPITMEIDESHTAGSQVALTTATPQVAAATAHTASPDLLGGSSPILMANDHVASQKSSMVPSVDLLEDSMASLKLSDSSLESMKSETAEVVKAEDPAPLINLSENYQGANRDLTRRRMLSSSHDDELSDIQSPLPVQAPAASHTATAVLSPKGNADGLLPNDDPMAKFARDMLRDIFKNMLATVNPETVKAILEEVTTVMFEAALASSDTMHHAKKQDTVTEPQLEPAATKAEIKQVTDSTATCLVDKIHNLLKPERAPQQTQLDGSQKEITTYTADELMNIRTPQEISAGAQGRIRELKLSPNTKPAQVANGHSVPTPSALAKTAAAGPSVLSDTQGQSSVKNGAAVTSDSMRPQISQTQQINEHISAGVQGREKARVQIKTPEGLVVGPWSPKRQTAPQAAVQQAMATAPRSSAGSGRGLASSRWAKQ